MQVYVRLYQTFSDMSSKRRDEIVAQSAQLFRTYGYNGASMRTVAEAVGIEAASLYNHIKSKSEILQEICFKVANKFLTHMDAVERSQKTTVEKLEDIIRIHIRMMLEEYEHVYVSDHEWKHLPEPYLSNFLNQRRSYRRRLADLVQEGIDRGEMKNIDPYVAVITFLSAIGGIEYWHRSRKAINEQEVEDNMVAYLVGGLRK
jgi:AcrR family transcriptional regulator